jgi:hypothetical protein
MQAEVYERETVCPYCGRRNDLHDRTDDGAGPQPGNVSLCWGCRGLSIFTVSGLRKPTDWELADIMADPHIRRILGAMRESTRPEQVRGLLR